MVMVERKVPKIFKIGVGHQRPLDMTPVEWVSLKERGRGDEDGVVASSGSIKGPMWS